MTEIAPGLSRSAVAEVVARALEEDLGATGDVTTTATVASTVVGAADLVPRQAGVVAGLSVAAYVFEVVSQGRLRVEFGTQDGARVTAGEVLATVRGPVRDMLTAERTALNLLGHLSGIATADPWRGSTRWPGPTPRSATPARRCPGCARWRSTRCGWAAASTTACRCRTPRWSRTTTWPPRVASSRPSNWSARPIPGCRWRSRSTRSSRPAPVIDAGADLVLLDNMPPAQLREVVDYAAGRARLEASGGLTLDRARAVAESGVDYLAVGALTHSAPVLDIGLDIETGHP